MRRYCRQNNFYRWEIFTHKKHKEHKRCRRENKSNIFEISEKVVMLSEAKHLFLRFQTLRFAQGDIFISLNLFHLVPSVLFVVDSLLSTFLLLCLFP
jgi:hypothetical protein